MKCIPGAALALALALAQPSGDGADRQPLGHVEPGGPRQSRLGHGLLPHNNAVVGKQIQQPTLREISRRRHSSLVDVPAQQAATS